MRIIVIIISILLFIGVSLGIRYCEYRSAVAWCENRCRDSVADILFDQSKVDAGDGKKCYCWGADGGYVLKDIK